MAWSDGLRRVTMADGRKLIGASFRGVPFYVDTSDRAGGRRTVKHEYPFRDAPFYEDLGRAARTFRIDGYVIGDDYLAQRDALISACEDEEGPGELIHPYHGTRSAICAQMAVQETRSEGRYAKFSLEFCETPAQAPQPSTVVDASDQVSTAADAANVATDAELVAQYSSSGLPSFALASCETAIKNAIAAMKDQLAPVISATQEAAELNSQASIITAEAASLVRTPGAILGAFRDALTALATTVIDAPLAVLNALTEAYSADLGPLTTATTSTRAKELANQTALQNGLRRVFAIEAARLAPTVTYVSLDEATATRDAIAAQLDEQAGLADDTAYPALVDLRAQLMRAVPGGAALASIVTVSRPVPIPSLLLTYQLYGSVDLEADVLARNPDVKHPGFVAGDLKVLSDG